MIDTGSGGSNEYVANLKEVLSNNESSIQEILITHWHPDHVGGICDVLNKCTENPGHKHNISITEMMAYFNLSSIQDVYHILNLVIQCTCMA